jgi:hypothetical protein
VHKTAHVYSGIAHAVGLLAFAENHLCVVQCRIDEIAYCRFQYCQAKILFTTFIPASNLICE